LLLLLRLALLLLISAPSLLLALALLIAVLVVVALIVVALLVLLVPIAVAVLVSLVVALVVIALLVSAPTCFRDVGCVSTALLTLVFRGVPVLRVAVAVAAFALGFLALLVRIALRLNARPAPFALVAVAWIETIVLVVGPLGVALVAFFALPIIRSGLLGFFLSPAPVRITFRRCCAHSGFPGTSAVLIVLYAVLFFVARTVLSVLVVIIVFVLVVIIIVIVVIILIVIIVVIIFLIRFRIGNVVGHGQRGNIVGIKVSL
jgi:hypothetical protein